MTTERLAIGAIGQLEAVSDRMESCALIGNLTRFLLNETHLAPTVGFTKQLVSRARFLG